MLLTRAARARALLSKLPSTTHAYSTQSASSAASAAVVPNARRNAIVAAGLLAASAAVYYYESREFTLPGFGPGHGGVETEFTVSIGSSKGPRSFTFKRLPEAETERKLVEHERSYLVKRKGNPVKRYDTSFVASNEPCEDRSAVDIVPRGLPKRSWSSWWPFTDAAAEADSDSDAVSNAEDGKRDLVLFSVIDGHAGDATSQLLSRTLHPTIALSLAALQAGFLPGSSSAWTRLSQSLTPWSKAPWSPPNVAKALEQAYIQLDDNICQTPLRLLPQVLPGSRPTPTPGSPSSSSPSPREMFVAMAAAASAGAVTASAVVDAENDGLYVAVAGDCRAVAGWQRPDGSWRCDVLTEDQMGENPREIARMRAEHPPYEADTVIRNGRVQGGLQPTRAFGDAVYKWTTAQGAAVADAFRAEGAKARPVRPWNTTPPYVTARPEVTHRKLHGSESGETLKFMVMATDGLWDQLTSEEATLLVASYLAHPKHADVSKTALPVQFPLAPTPGERPYPAEDLPGTGKRASGAWAFEGDSNAATHLIRNALGGADRKSRGETLSMHGKVTRSVRDDITVTVVFFGDDDD